MLLKDRDITGAAPHRICLMGMGRSFQRTNIFPKLTVFENVQAAFIAHRGAAAISGAVVASSIRGETEALLGSLGLLDKADAISGALSHGNQKQVELGIALACDPRDAAARRADRRHVGARRRTRPSRCSSASPRSAT